MRATILLLIPLLISGCSTSEAPQHTFSEYIDEGVLVAANAGGPRYQGDLFQYDRVVILNQDPDQPESLLASRSGFAWDEKGFFMDEEGRFIVRDRCNTRIAVYDPAGEFERSIGRKGDGPGEWSGSFEIYNVTDDVLEIYDPGPHRFTWYRTDGTLLEMISAPVIGFQTRYVPENERFVAIGGEVEMGTDFISYNVGFTVVTDEGETVASAWTEKIPGRFSYPWETRTGVAWEAMPFAVPPFSAWISSGGVLLSTGREPVVLWYGLDGVVRKKITIDLSPDPVTSEDLDEYFSELGYRSGVADNPRQQERLRRIRTSVQHPDHHPFWGFMTVDDSGYIWLEVPEFDAERRARGGVLYHVLSPEGEFLGVTRAPVAGRVMRGHLLGVMVDRESDEETYAVWRLIPESTGLRYP